MSTVGHQNFYNPPQGILRPKGFQKLKGLCMYGHVFA